MRRQLPACGQNIDARDLQRVAHVHGQAAKATETVTMYRSISASVRTEQELRTRIADQHPVLHGFEQQARDELHRQRRQERAALAAQNQSTAATYLQAQRHRGSSR